MSSNRSLTTAPGLATALVAVLLLHPLAASGQETRREMVDRALMRLQPSEIVDDLVRAADPALEPMDSLWALGVHYLAETYLLELGDRESAELWLRWVTRHGSHLRVDSSLLRPAAAELAREVRASVERAVTAESSRSTTSWLWPSEVDREAPGGLEVRAESGVPVRVTVLGGPDAPAGASMPPGTYDLEIGREGFEPLRITREVLPGVTTVLDVELVPVLAAEVEAEVALGMVLVSWQQDGQRMCTNGILEREGTVVTVLPPAATDRPLEVTTPERIYENVRATRTDPGSGLAVLRLEGGTWTPLPHAPEEASGVYAWAVHREGCGSPTTTRTRIGTWSASGTATIDPSLPSQATGAPLVDRAGALFGVVTGPGEVASISRAQALLEQAIAQVVAPPEPAGRSRRWLWIGGAGAAGVLAAVVLGRGPGADKGSDQGTIVIKLPGGTP